MIQTAGESIALFLVDIMKKTGANIQEAAILALPTVLNVIRTDCTDEELYTAIELSLNLIDKPEMTAKVVTIH